MHTPLRHRVSVIVTVKNDAHGIRKAIDSIARQTRPPDELVVVDGGSIDRTPRVLRDLASRHRWIRVLHAPGANIATGRNLGTLAATGDIIATTDSGCRAADDWLQKLIEPFERDSTVEFVAGFYRVEATTLLEHTVGLATMRGALDPVDPARFNPSGRSMAYTKSLWSRMGGWPEWIRFSEDTLFDHKLRHLGIQWRFAPDAVVYWRPRSSLSAIARQFYHYGTGRGHTQIGAADFRYNLRNASLVAFAAVIAWFEPLAWAAVAGLVSYFYVWTFHRLADRIRRKLGPWRAYGLSLVVMWTVLSANLVGYLVGSWQRCWVPLRFRRRQEEYFATA